jgi:hypothetical protein
MISLPNLSQLNLITPEPTDVKRVNPFAQPRRDAKPETPVQNPTWKMLEERREKTAEERLARMQRREDKKAATVDLNVELTHAVTLDDARRGGLMTSRAILEFVINIPKASELERLIPFFWFDRARDDRRHRARGDRRHRSELYHMSSDIQVSDQPDMELQQALNVARYNSTTNDHRLRMLNAMRDMGVKHVSNEGFTSTSTDVIFDVRFSQGSTHMPAKLYLSWEVEYLTPLFFTTMVADSQLSPAFDAFRQKFMQTIDLVLLQTTGRRLNMETEMQTNQQIKLPRYQSGTDLYEAEASYKFATR